MKDFLVRIDVSKEKIDVCVLATESTEPLGFSIFGNGEKGFSRMLAWLKKLKAPPKKCLFGLEHTGVYSWPLANFLQGQELSYCMESGLQIAQSSGINRGKSDKQDAHLIALYLRRYQGELEYYKLPTHTLQEMKILFYHRKRLVKMKVALKTASGEINAFSEECTTQKMSQSSDTILGAIKEGIKQTEKGLKQLVQNDDSIKKNYELVQSVPGIGLQTAVAFLVLTANFTLFDDARKFACYAGVAPFAKQSGKSVYRKAKVSKVANGGMKALLSMCTQQAIKYDPQIKTYYQKKQKEGKPERTIRNAIMNKLIHRVFAVVKRGTAFTLLGQHASA